jgi:hypothetical protein
MHIKTRSRCPNGLGQLRHIKQVRHLRYYRVDYWLISQLRKSLASAANQLILVYLFKLKLCIILYADM